MMEMSIPVDGKKGNYTARAGTFSTMEVFSKGILKMAKGMAMGPTFGQMGINMLENGSMARVMDRVYSHGQMEKATQVTGKMVNMMVTGHTL